MFGGSLDRVRNALESLRTRLWLMPAVMCIASAILARMATKLDDYPIFRELDTWWYFGGEPETARELLGTLLSGMLTMTSLVVSITMVVLSLAANQLGPRLIWNFIRDRQIQVVIGAFFATIVFILVALRSIDQQRVPDVAVTFATALVGFCLFALLFYVHKIARSIVADTVIDHVATDLQAHIRSLPDVHGSVDDEAFGDGLRTSSVSLERSGYLQVIEYERLLEIADKNCLTIEILVRPGDFLLCPGAHVQLHCEAEPSGAVLRDLRGAFLVGSQRTPTQDIEYSVRQLVEIAVRALSPGINDPVTAISVVHRLSESLALLTRKNVPDRVVLFRKDGAAGVRGHATGFKGATDAAFNQIRQAASAQADVAVLISIVSMLGQLGPACRSEGQREALLAQLEATGRAAERTITEPLDLRDFASAYRTASTRLSSHAPAPFD